jgi:hypothetical protein
LADEDGAEELPAPPALPRDDPMLAGASGGGAAAVVAAGAGAAAGVLATGAGVVVVAGFPLVGEEEAVPVREPTVAGLQVLAPDVQPVRRLAISEA